MRHLVLACLALFVGFVASVRGADEGPFQDLVRKPVNSVCPLDGNAVDTHIAPTPMVGADGQEVLVGACSAACAESMRGKFGDDAKNIAAAARANLPLSKMPKTNALAGTAGNTTAGKAGTQNPGPITGAPVGQLSTTGAGSTSGLNNGGTNKGGIATSPKMDQPVTPEEPKDDKSKKGHKKHKGDDANAAPGKEHDGKSGASAEEDARQEAKKKAQRKDEGKTDNSSK